MCKSCGGRRSALPPSVRVAATSAAPKMTLDDASFKMCVYTHPSRGQQHVYGSPLFRERLEGVPMIQDRTTRLWRIHYGWRAGGDRFLVHVEDIKRTSHLFREEQALRPPVVERPPVAPPTPIAEPEPEPVAEEPARITPAPRRIDVGAVIRINTADGIQAGEARADLDQYEAVKGNGEFDPQKLPGVTPKIAQAMRQKGITALEDVLDLGEEGLRDIAGVGEVRAKAIYGRAMEMAANGV